MKKYFILAAAALVAMCACTKTMVNDAPEQDQAISFQVANYSAATKAGDVTLSGNEAFGVFAFYNTERWTANSSIADKYMPGVGVYHGDGTGEIDPNDKDDWYTDEDYYWPKTGYLTFVGWSPFYTGSDAAKNATYPSITAGITWTDFVITSSMTDNSTLGNGNKTDLLYTVPDTAKDLQANGSKYGHNGVPMIFNHALAKLNFTLEYNTDGLTEDQIKMFEIRVTDITIPSMGYKATYTEGAWTVSATTATPANKESGQQLNPNMGLSDVLKYGNLTQTDYVTDYFIIPQGVKDVVINYTVNGIAAATETVSLAFDTAKSAWAKNHVYTYNIKISPVGLKKITFDPMVSAWEEPKETEISLPSAS